MSKQCPQCGAENADSSKFCLKCGAPLPAQAPAAPAGGAPAGGQVTCPSCGASNAAGSKFCLKCGQPLPAVPKPGSAPQQAPGAPVGPAPKAASGKVVCPACGKENDPSNKFCLGCGKPLGAAAAGSKAGAGSTGAGPAAGASAPHGAPAGAQPGAYASTPYPQQPHYAPVASQEAPFSAALHDISHTQGGVGRTLLLGLIGMVPILTWFSGGYIYRWGAELLQGRRTDMPHTVMGDGNFKIGFFAAVINVAFGIVAGLVIALIRMPFDALNIGIIADIIGFVISQAVTLFAMLCCLNMALEGRFGAGFSLSKAWGVIKRNPGGAIVAYIVPAIIFYLLGKAATLVLALVLLGPAAVGTALSASYTTTYLFGLMGAAALYGMLNYLANAFISMAGSLVIVRSLAHWAADAAPEWGGRQPVLTAPSFTPAPGSVPPAGAAPRPAGPAPVAPQGPQAAPAAPKPAPAPAPVAPAPAAGTVKCPACGRENAATSRFCLGCGHPLSDGPAKAPAPVHAAPAPVAPAAPTPAPQSAPAAPAPKPAAPAPQPQPAAPAPAPAAPAPFSAPEPGEASAPTGSDAGTTLLVPTVALLRSNGKRYTISNVPATLGKGSAADVLIEGNEAISRVHARILYAGDQFVVEDMGSSNKTYINGDVLAPHDPVALRDGDTLRLANEEFTVWIS